MSTYIENLCNIRTLNMNSAFGESVYSHPNSIVIEEFKKFHMERLDSYEEYLDKLIDKVILDEKELEIKVVTKVPSTEFLNLKLFEKDLDSIRHLIEQVGKDYSKLEYKEYEIDSDRVYNIDKLFVPEPTYVQVYNLSEFLSYFKKVLDDVVAMRNDLRYLLELLKEALIKIIQLGEESLSIRVEYYLQALSMFRRWMIQLISYTEALCKCIDDD